MVVTNLMLYMQRAIRCKSPYECVSLLVEAVSDPDLLFGDYLTLASFVSNKVIPIFYESEDLKK